MAGRARPRKAGSEFVFRLEYAGYGATQTCAEHCCTDSGKDYAGRMPKSFDFFYC